MRWIRLATLLFPALVASSAFAQQAGGVPLAFLPESKLSIAGTSTLHDFSCATQTIQPLVRVDSLYTSSPFAKIPQPIISVDVTVPVRSLKCGHGKMDENMYATLREKWFPAIHYVLASYEVAPDAALPDADAFTAKTVGTLTIAGQDKSIEMLVQVTRGSDGIAHAMGSVEVLLTDFGIKPPSFVFGTLKVGNKITVTFDVAADRAAALAIGLDSP